MSRMWSQVELRDAVVSDSDIAYVMQNARTANATTAQEPYIVVEPDRWWRIWDSFNPSERIGWFGNPKTERSALMVGDVRVFINAPPNGRRKGIH